MKQTENERIKFLREELGLTQIEFSTRVGINHVTQSRIEGGTMAASPKYLRKVIMVFGIKSEWLLDGKGDKYKTGTVEENRKRAIDYSVNSLNDTNPWRDALVSELKEEVSYLKKLLEMALGGGGGGKTNFLPATDLLRVAFKKKLAA